METTSTNGVQQTNLPFPNRRSGKVRDIYDLPTDSADQPNPRVLIITTDRLSAFDVVLPTLFPQRGCLLTDITTHWFDWVVTHKIIDHHLISTDATALPITEDQQHPLLGRSMICKKTQVIPIECVARGYITGSGWKEYQQSGSVCGIQLPDGLEQCEKLPEPIFTPATKAEEGHDENISFKQAGEIIGHDTIKKLRDLTLTIYKAAAQYAEERGIIIADTKFEFGYELKGLPLHLSPENIILIDEILTPDSSRFWPKDKYAPGRDQESFDKQIIRNHLETIVKNNEWDKTPPGPEIPNAVVQKTIQRYVEVKDRLFSS